MAEPLATATGAGLFFPSTRHTCATGGSCWNGLMSQWTDPTNRNELVASGMQVTQTSGTACISGTQTIAANTGLNPIAWGIAAVPVRQQELLPASGTTAAETDWAPGTSYAAGARVAANGGHWMTAAGGISGGGTTVYGFPSTVLNNGAVAATVTGTTMTVDVPSVLENGGALTQTSIQFWTPATGLVPGGPYTITAYTNGNFTLSSSPGTLPSGSMAVVPHSVVLPPMTYPGAFGQPWLSSYVGTTVNDGSSGSGGVSWVLTGREDVKMLPTGVINLSTQPSAVCPANAVFQFTESPTQLEALSTDYVAAQTATAIASNGVQGGESFAPPGQYEVNHTIIVPSLVVNTNINAPTTVIRGAGQNLTSIHVPSDLGWDKFAITESNVGTDGTLAEALYQGFNVYNEQNGAGTIVVGTRLINMRGIGIGKFSRMDHVTVQGFGSGIVENKDHQILDNMAVTNNACDIEMGEYEDTVGNQVWSDSGIGGGQTASICIGDSAAIDSAGLYEVHTGGAPRSIYTLPSWPNVSVAFPEEVGGTNFVDVWMENIGEEFEYSNNRDFGGNRIIGGGAPGIGTPGTAIINVGVNGSPTVPPRSVFFNGQPYGAGLYPSFDTNTLIGTDLGAAFNPPNGFNKVTDAIIESGGGGFNMFVNDSTLILGGSASLPALAAAVSQSFAANTWQTPLGSGFLGVLSGTPLLSGEPVRFTGNGQVVNGYTDGAALAGFAVVGCPGNISDQCPVQTTGAVQNVTNVSGVAINATSPIGATNTAGASSPGVMATLSGQGAVGYAVSGFSAGGTGTIMLSPAYGGAPGSATGLTATGTTQANAYQITATLSDFSTVASGSGAILGLIPVGSYETICNDGTNTLGVYAPVGDTIAGGATNASTPLASTACRSFWRTGPATFH